MARVALECCQSLPELLQGAPAEARGLGNARFAGKLRGGTQGSSKVGGELVLVPTSVYLVEGRENPQQPQACPALRCEMGGVEDMQEGEELSPQLVLKPGSLEGHLRSSSRL